MSNAIERAVVLAASSEIRPEDLPESLLETSTALDPSTQYHDKINEVKRRLVVEALEVCQGNVTHAAKRLGLHPNYLHRLIRNLGLKSEAR